MSRKSSWWLRPQRKGASNRAALNEANYFMEHNKALRERIKEIASENARLRELAAGIGHLLFSLDVDYCATCPRDNINRPCPVYTVEGGECLYKTDLRDLGVEVNA